MTLTLTKTQVTPLPGALIRTVKLGEAASGGAGMAINSSSNMVKADGDSPGLRRVFGVLITDNQGSYNRSEERRVGKECRL